MAGTLFRRASTILAFACLTAMGACADGGTLADDGLSGDTAARGSSESATALGRRAAQQPGASQNEDRPTGSTANVEAQAQGPSGSAAARRAEQSFVTVANGHLSRGGMRIRQWGVNLQSGVFRTYSEIDNLVARLDALGFNAVRLWPTAGTFYSSTTSGVVANQSAKGDGSDLDRFDYLVWRLGQAGMTIQMTMLHYLDLPMLRGTRQLQAAGLISPTMTDAEVRRLHGFAPYVSDVYRSLLEQHIRHVLQRVNPYTGTRYADERSVSTWELANEATFVSCAIAPDCISTLPATARSDLSGAWRASALNPGAAPIPSDLEKGGDALTVAYRRFVAQRFIQVSNELRKVAMGVGGAGSGVSVQPFIFSTGPGTAIAAAHFAYGAGDVLALGAYRSPLTAANGLNGTPWRPISMGGPPIPFLEYAKIEGKPLVIYETSFFRPYPYRAEWGPVMAAIGLQQDWDAVFLYTYGQPWAIYEGEGLPSQYGRRPLPEPVAGHPNSYYGSYDYGFHHGGDPIVMASWSIGARLFIDAEDSAAPTQTAVWDLPLDGAFKAGHGYPAALLSPTNRIDLPRTRAVGLRFVETSSDVRCNPCTSNAPTGAHANPVHWEGSYLRVETAGGTAIVGTLPSSAPIAIRDQITVLASKTEFAVAAAIPSGSSTAPSTRVYVLGNAENTGSQFNPQLVDYGSPVGALRGSLVRGETPIVYRGPTVTFSLARSELNVCEVDFSLNQIAIKRPLDGSYQLNAARGVFFADVSPAR